MERRRFSPTMASEWQTAFVSQNATGVPCSLPSRITTKVLKTARLFLQDRDQMFKTIRLHDPRPRLSFLSLRVETKNLVSRITGFWARRDSIEPNSYGNVAGWLSVTAGIVSKRLNLS